MSELSNATTHRTFISYIDRTRELYAAQGYERPYAWARNADAPFAALAKPLAESRVTLVTTASPWTGQSAKDGVLRGNKGVWSGPTSEPPERLFTDDLAWDKETTHMRDVESFLPLRQLAAYAESGRIGSVAPSFHGIPTDYSQRRTLVNDAPEVLRRCQAEQVDLALLVPI